MFHHFRAMRAMKKNIRRSASVIRAHSDPSIPYFRAIRLWTLLEGMNTLSRASGSLQSFRVGVGGRVPFTQLAIDDRPVGVRWRLMGFEGDEVLTAREEKRRVEKD